MSSFKANYQHELEADLDAKDDEIGSLKRDLDFQTTAAFENQARANRAESALVAAEEKLTAYKDYYGTSPAQVKHLAECEAKSGDGHLPCGYWDSSTRLCPDYPSE